MTDQELGDFPADFGAKRRAIAKRLINVSFGISAVNQGGDRQKLPGSGVFISPGLGLTAKHVMTDIMKLHHGRPKNLELIPISVQLQQVPTLDCEEFRVTQMPSWRLREFIECPYSDLALLDVEPLNTAAEELAASRYRDSLFSMRLLPPHADERAMAFGFPGIDWDFDEEAKRMDVKSGITMAEGRVTEVFDEWRVEPQPPPPSILLPPTSSDHALTDFPCFEMTTPVEEGMSGGPIFYGDFLLGIVSAGFELEPGDSEDGARSRAATLWPLMFIRNFPHGIERVPFISLFESGEVHASDWPDAQKLTYLDEFQGRKRARMHRRVG